MRRPGAVPIGELVLIDDGTGLVTCVLVSEDDGVM